MSVFSTPEPLVLRILPDGRRTVAAVGSMKTDSGEGCTIPLKKLGALAAWLVDAARAIPRPDNDNGKGWAK